MGYLYLYGATVQRRKGTKVEVEVEVETARLKEQSDIVPRSGSMTTSFFLMRFDNQLLINIIGEPCTSGADNCTGQNI